MKFKSMQKHTHTHTKTFFLKARERQTQISGEWVGCGCNWRGHTGGSKVFINWVMSLQVIIFLVLKLYIHIRYSLLYL